MSPQIACSARYFNTCFIAVWWAMGCSGRTAASFEGWLSTGHWVRSVALWAGSMCPKSRQAFVVNRIKGRPMDLGHGPCDRATFS
eukprot:1506025-Alexandrium_andersonii.AAC.1